MRPLATPLATLEPACCCSARPVVIVVLPANERTQRGAVDLLLCSHHFRDSWKALEVAGALVFDAADRLVFPTVAEPGAGPRLAELVDGRRREALK